MQEITLLHILSDKNLGRRKKGTQLIENMQYLYGINRSRRIFYKLQRIRREKSYSNKMSTKQKNKINFTEQIQAAQRLYNRYAKSLKRKKKITKQTRIDNRLHRWLKRGAAKGDFTIIQFQESFLWPHYFKKNKEK